MKAAAHLLKLRKGSRGRVKKKEKNCASCPQERGARRRNWHPGRKKGREIRRGEMGRHSKKKSFSGKTVNRPAVTKR